MIKGTGRWSYDESGGAWYFALTERADPPYRTQVKVEAIIYLHHEGRTAGIEMIDTPGGKLIEPPTVSSRQVDLLAPHFMVTVSLYATDLGGRLSPIRGDVFRCPCKFDAKDFSAWDCGLLLRGASLAPGQAGQFGIVFLSSEIAVAFRHCRKFFLWEGHVIGEACTAPA
jgi:hypothetical protein